MEILETILPIVIDILLVVLLVVGIIIGIKCIYIMDKAKAIILNVEEKVNSLNALFSVVSLVNDKIAFITEKTSSVIEKLVTKFFKKHDKDEYDEEDELESIIEKERNE